MDACRRKSRPIIQEILLLTLSPYQRRVKSVRVQWLYPYHELFVVLFVDLEVRERRRAKEESKKKALERELLSREASRHVLEEMKKEEEARKLRTKMEEKAIQHHMVAIRRQMTEQKERERYIFSYTRLHASLSFRQWVQYFYLPVHVAYCMYMYIYTFTTSTDT